MLQDIAELTGTQVVSEDLGFTLEHVTVDKLGHAKRVVVDKDTATMIGGGGGGDRYRIEGRRADPSRDRKDHERLRPGEATRAVAKLAGGVAVNRVGSSSEAEMKSKKEALDDAISATKAAVSEGIVPGGGLALLRSTSAIEQEEEKCSGDERTGVQILKCALEMPTRQIAENSAVDGGVVLARMLAGEGNYGFDTGRKEYVNLVEAGIIDPTKVVRIALENAVSIAGVLLLSEATMTEIPETEGRHWSLRWQSNRHGARWSYMRMSLPCSGHRFAMAR